MFKKLFGKKVAVYPRWRGEHNSDRCICLFDAGLSPLARGTLSEAAASQFTAGFIPAGAGNTCI